MAGENTVEFTLEAKDLTTAALSRVSQQVENLIKQNERLAQSGATGAVSIGRMENQLNRLTTANGLAYEAVRRVNSAIAGFFIGSTIGFVLGAMSGLTERIKEQIAAWFSAAAAIEQYKKKYAELVSQNDLIATLRARQLQVADQIKSTTQELAGLDSLINQPRGVWEFFTFAPFNSADAQANFAANQTRLAFLIGQWNELNDSIRGAQENDERAKKTLNKADQEKELLASIGFDPMRSVDLQRQRAEFDLIDKWREDERKLELADTKAHADDMALIKTWEQDQFTAAARRGMLERDKVRQMELERQQNLAYATQFILGSLMAFQNSNSRTMFRVAQLAAISDATIHTYMAANKALASAPPPWNYALAAAVAAARLQPARRAQSGGWAGERRAHLIDTIRWRWWRGRCWRLNIHPHDRPRDRPQRPTDRGQYHDQLRRHRSIDDRSADEPARRFTRPCA